ncbi:MAG: metallophosphoesterase [Armatimonadetes bacterium]|nr:metallophosphoesterase [Armatimonadota bacterium]
MADNRLVWYHFSDLHARPTDEYNRSRVLAALWDDLKYHLDEGRVPDLIFFSGDVANSGQSGEYDFAEDVFFGPLTEVVQTDRTRIGVVPGNHDCDWELSRTIAYPNPEALADEVTRLLENPSLRRMYMTPMHAHAEFAKKFVGDDEDYDPGDIGGLRRFKVRDRWVAVLCLNSTWLSGPLVGNVTDGDTERERGNLVVGEKQLTDAMMGVQPDDLVIALMHHPLDWLGEVDRQAIELLLHKQCQFLLCGHLHSNRAVIQKTPQGDLVQVPTGTLYEGRDFPNGYSIGIYDFDTGETEFWLRRYQREADEWQRDLASTGDRNGGVLRFEVDTLRGIARTVEDEKIHAASPHSGAALMEAMAGPSTNVRDYDLEFTDACRRSLERLEMSEDDLIDLVQKEFRSHVNYFRFDLEHYPLPVRDKLIVYMDKAGNTLRFTDVAAVNVDLALLSTWHDILAVYRGATRLRYRQDPNAFVMSPGSLARVIGIHDDLAGRISKYFSQFWSMRTGADLLGWDEKLREAAQEHPDRVEDEQLLSEDERVISFYLQQSKLARTRAWEAWEASERGDISLEDALVEIVTGLETSLQYLHKIILEHSPADSQHQRAE